MLKVTITVEHEDDENEGRNLWPADQRLQALVPIDESLLDLGTLDMAAAKLFARVVAAARSFDPDSEAT